MATITENSVTILSTRTVQSPSDLDLDLDRRVELTPWDLRLLRMGPIKKGLLYHAPKDTATDSLIHRLKSSLSRTLRFFPPLAGRLSRTDSDDGAAASFFIDCNNAGARFVHATARSVSVSDVVGPAYVPLVVLSFFALDKAGNEEGLTLPLLAVQVTELNDGVFVGCTVNHVAADGDSFWLFLNSWSEISRGSDTITKPPHIRRWFRECQDRPIRIPLGQLSGENAGGYRDHSPPNLAERVFHFTKERVGELKARANSEMGMDGRISSLQAVLAHLWRSFIVSQRSKSDFTFMLPIGVRRRLLQLPDHYFGNAAYGSIITMKASEVAEHGASHVAWEINKAIGSCTQEKLETFLDDWVRHPTLITMDGSRKNMIMISSSPRFDIYGNDFSWGRPVAVRNGDRHNNGQITLFAGIKPGSIEVHACLDPQVLCAMEKDDEFMDTVTA